MTELSRPGRIAMASDAVATAAAIASAMLAIIGPYRQVVAGTAVTIGWMHAAFAAAAIGAIRHAAMPRPTWLASLRVWRAALEGHPALSDALAITLLTRLPMVVVGLLATSTIGLPPNTPAESA
ncbi:MAG: hypothetical protein ABIX28_17315, partial [Vicinamibacterales bacterium]